MHTIIFHYKHAWKSQTIIKKNKINYSDPPQDFVILIRHFPEKNQLLGSQIFKVCQKKQMPIQGGNGLQKSSAVVRTTWGSHTLTKMTSASQSLSTIYIPAIEKHIKEYMSRCKIKVNLCREGSYSLAHTLKTWTSRPVFRWGKRYSQIQVKL